MWPWRDLNTDHYISLYKGNAYLVDGVRSTLAKDIQVFHDVGEGETRM
jgi:hypothetical protein